jgi:hypothetical protein
MYNQSCGAIYSTSVFLKKNVGYSSEVKLSNIQQVEMVSSTVHI